MLVRVVVSVTVTVGWGSHFVVVVGFGGAGVQVGVGVQVVVGVQVEVGGVYVDVVVCAGCVSESHLASWGFATATSARAVVARRESLNCIVRRRITVRIDGGR